MIPKPMAEPEVLAPEPSLDLIFTIVGVVGAVLLIAILALVTLALIKYKKTKAINVRIVKVYAEFPSVEEHSQRHLMVNDLESQRVPIEEVYCIAVEEENETEEKQYRVSEFTEEQVTQHEDVGEPEA